MHTSFAGAGELKTPAFDFLANEGVHFNNAYCAVSSCAPSRATILTGKAMWNLQEGGLLFGGLPKEHATLPAMLAANGYQTAWTGKGYAPANEQSPKYHQQVLGTSFHEFKGDYHESLMDCDYASNFEQFMQQRDDQQPFFFWYGGHEPHRIYERGIGKKSGKNISRIQVPDFLPDNDTVRNDIADYYYEIEWFDSHLARMLKILEQQGELENTMIIVTADNGMPFPRAKATCYEYGTHMPLVVYWGDKIPKGRTVDDFISFMDFTPTILEAAGIDIPENISGKSFLQQLKSNLNGFIDQQRDQVVTALERHTYCRKGGLTYPIRAIRKGEMLYIHNFENSRWPAGDTDFYSPHQGYYGDIDAGATRSNMLEHQNDDHQKKLFEASFGKRPTEELFNIMQDPENLNNLAEVEEYQATKAELKEALFTYLKAHNDPRINGESPWEDMPYYFEGFDKKHLLPIPLRDTLQESIAHLEGH